MMPLLSVLKYFILAVIYYSWRGEGGVEGGGSERGNFILFKQLLRLSYLHGNACDFDFYL